MKLEEAIKELRKSGFMLEDTETKVKNNMMHNNKPTNLYWAAECCLNHRNAARSKDILADDVVTNWHNLVPLMTKTASDGNRYFSHKSTDNASIWSLTEYGYEKYKEASDLLHYDALPYKEPPMDKETAETKAKETKSELYKILKYISDEFDANGPSEDLCDKLDTAKSMMKELVELIKNGWGRYDIR